MNNFANNFIKLVLFYILIIGLSSCTEDNHVNDSSFLIGTWKYIFYDCSPGEDEEPAYLLYTFNNDGTGSYTEVDNGDIDSGKFIYILDEEHKIIYATFNDGEEDVHATYQIVSCNRIIVRNFFDDIEEWIKID